MPKLLARDRLTQGIAVRGSPEGLRIDLHVVVEYGLNLAEVASTVRSRVGYEVGRLTGLPVASVEVHVDDVRQIVRVSSDLDTVRGLARAALASLEANRRRIDDLNVYPGAGRRHRDEPDADRPRRRRGARRVDARRTGPRSRARSRAPR